MNRILLSDYNALVLTIHPPRPPTYDVRSEMVGGGLFGFAAKFPCRDSLCGAEPIENQSDNANCFHLIG